MRQGIYEEEMEEKCWDCMRGHKQEGKGKEMGSVLPPPALAFSMMTSDMEDSVTSAADSRVPLTISRVRGFFGLVKHLTPRLTPGPTSASETHTVLVTPADNPSYL